MNAELRTSKGIVPILHWIGKQMVDEVPQEIALCEFDCDQTQCTRKEWKACPRRLRKAVEQ